jgi:hypothetical protein
MKIFSNQSLDIAGIWTSLLCAVHCLFLPLVSVSAFSGLVFLADSKIENAVILISAALGATSLLPSYFRHHRNIKAIGFLLSGFFLIVLSRFLGGVHEVVLTTVGATLVSAAHVINFRLCKKID